MPPMEANKPAGNLSNFEKQEKQQNKNVYQRKKAFFLIEKSLTYNAVLISGVLHNDLTFVYVMK